MTMSTKMTNCITISHSRLRKKTTMTETVPVIDFRQLGRHSTRSLVVRDIGIGLQKLGCFQVINHGIQKSVMKDALQAAANFSQLPDDMKQELESEDARKPVRYAAGSLGENGNERSFLKHYAHPLSKWIHFWPVAPPDYRERMGKYAMEVRRVALELMDAILESLKLRKGHLIRDKLDQGMQVMVVNFYPKNSQPNLTVGLAPHSDYGFITILLQTCEGLQILDKDGESWKEVPRVPGTLHVHIGDHMGVLSNGKYNSLMHRAVLNSRKRISIASIHGLALDEKVATPEELVDEQHPKMYRESSFNDFLDYISSTNDTTRGKSFIESLRI